MFILLIVVGILFVCAMEKFGNNPDNTPTLEEQEKYAWGEEVGDQTKTEDGTVWTNIGKL